MVSEQAVSALQANLRVSPSVDGGERTVLAAFPGGPVRTRDACLAAEGLLAAGQASALKDTLEEIFAHQSEDGLFPSGLPDLGPAIDSNALVVWASCRLTLATGENAWAQRWLPLWERAMAYYEARERDWLVPQRPGWDWKDTLRCRRGTVFLTQLLRWRALGALNEVYRRLGGLKSCASVQGQAKQVARQARRAFWDAGSGYFRESQDCALFAAEANLAAAAWGFADEEECSRILRALDRLGLNTPWGPRAGQDHPAWAKTWRSWLARTNPRHDRAVWPWLLALQFEALRRCGREALLSELLAGPCARVASAGFPESLLCEEDREPRPGPGPSSLSAGALLGALSPAGYSSGARF